ncbi:MAG TPA: ABC transporter substrate-binding protein [Eubacterium sp.]|nr:ABC transporter substrate-binding protein [Eubacterium sp.]HCW37698.1 ABC transporter substrate-binding protein [Eubacterium sp.]
MKKHFKKLLLMALMAVMAVGLIACGTDKSDNESTKEEKTSVTITSLDASKNEIELEVPYNPKRIAILDLACLDIIDELGVGDRVVGMASTSIDYLEKYSNDASIKNLGTIKEADLEAVMECEPDIIFIGGRLSKSYDALSEIAPVVYLATDTNEGLVNSVSKNAKTIASIFGMEDKVDSLMSDFGARIDAIKKISSGKTALVGMTTSGSFNLLGNDGRCSLIGVEAGFNNLTAVGSTSTHGNESSFETVVQQNPDYIFVMDRDSAISTAGAKTAKEIVENELVKTTDAYKNNHIIYLEHSNVWYTAEGGIQALDIMLTDLEKGLK